MDYKYKIDKTLLDEFLLSEHPSQQAIKQFRKVVLIVVIKHYPQYIQCLEDYNSLCSVEVLSTRSRFDPSFSSYNYLYSKCRNIIGNYIRRKREVVVEEILPLSNASVSDNDVQELPAEIGKYFKPLTGQEEFSIREIPKKDAINLALFILQHSSLRKLKVPSFINAQDINLLYKLLLML
jgi:hypothetical protein